MHAHTNPVWLYFNGQAPFKPEAAGELLKKIQGFEASKISPEAKKVAEAARSKVEQMLREGDNPPRPATTYSQRFPVSPSSAMRFPPVLARPKSLAPVTVEGIVVGSSGRPVAGAAVSARGLDPATRTDAAGRFVLRGVDANKPLFLRVSRAAHATTNTPYLNPRGPRENLRILLLTSEELQSVQPDASSHATMLLNSIGRREADCRPQSDRISVRSVALRLPEQNRTGADRRDYGYQLSTGLPSARQRS